MIRVKNQKAVATLSKRSVKANKTRNAVAVFAIALTTFLFTTLFTVTGTMIYTSQQQTFRQVGGSFHGGFKNLSLKEKELLEKDARIQESGSRLMLGHACGEAFQKVQAEVSYMDETYRKYGFCVPEYGQAPKEGTKEIACDTRVLQTLGIEPKIGEPVTLAYEIGGAKKEEITDTFSLSGWWEYDTANPVSAAVLPRSYVEDTLKTHSVDTEDASNSTGTWSLNFFLSNSLHIEEEMTQILQSYGYQTTNPAEDNYIGSGVNWGYAAAQMSANDDLGTVAGMAAIAVLIVVTGYLIIYNIFQISVSGDIRFYGLLKTIGTTGRQIRRMIRRQAVWLSVAGIPAGLVCGYLSGALLAPLMISSMSNGQKTYQAANPWIFIGGSRIFACNRSAFLRKTRQDRRKSVSRGSGPLHGRPVRKKAEKKKFF